LPRSFILEASMLQYRKVGTITKGTHCFAPKTLHFENLDKFFAHAQALGQAACVAPKQAHGGAGTVPRLSATVLLCRAARVPHLRAALLLEYYRMCLA